MDDYKATRQGSRNLVLTRNDIEKGRAVYHKWSTSKADLTMADGSTYILRPKGVWHTSTEITQDGRVLATYKLTWRKGTELNTYFDVISEQYHLRLKGFWKGKYELQDANKEPVLSIVSSFSWKGFRTTYHIQPSVALERSSHKDLLVMITLCCLLQQHQAQASGAGAAG
ncbi:MAG: hypothetical protein EOO09_21580 [Chitinophagaceae bacterium]|nr:MAG: hypothetical protein EOO09_21580 [Chitinophagaceae bacterium]